MFGTYGGEDGEYSYNDKYFGTYVFFLGKLMNSFYGVFKVFMGSVSVCNLFFF